MILEDPGNMTSIRNTSSSIQIHMPLRGLLMLIKDLAKCDQIIAADNTNLCEFFHPDREGLDLPYSLALAKLEPGKSSLPHRLKTSSEVYLILNGVGEIHIDSEQAEVRAGQFVLIPPGSWQHIRNTGDAELKFLCIVSPMWRAEDEEVVR
jgi:mannose-6-phosphate isomerase-like protein (cupin superfamily)